MSVPSELRYTKDHEWARLESDGTVRVGITQFAQEALGDVVYVELGSAAGDVAQGQSFGQVESTKSVSELYAPISGEVLEVNVALETEPQLVNSDPYGRGWLVRLKPSNLAEADTLLLPDAYTQHIAAGH